MQEVGEEIIKEKGDDMNAYENMIKEDEQAKYFMKVLMEHENKIKELDEVVRRLVINKEKQLYCDSLCAYPCDKCAEIIIELIRRYIGKEEVTT